MDVWKVKLEDEILPKYAYFCNAFEDIYERVKKNLSAYYNEDEELPPKTVQLFVCQMEAEKCPIAKDEFTKVFTEHMLKIPDCVKRLDFQDFLGQSIEPQTFTLLILSESLKSQLRLKIKNMIFIIVDGKKHFDLKEQRLSTTMETVFSDTDRALEEIITSKVEPMYRKLFDLHRKSKQRSKDDYSHVRAAEHMKGHNNGDVTKLPRKLQHELNAPGSRSKTNTDILSGLVAEMGALFDISDFPVVLEKKTDVAPITKEVCDTLKAVCPSIKRIGYRFGTLEIQAVIDKETEAEIKENIQDTLKKFNIFHYQITGCLEQIRYFTWIGSKVETGNGFGTFGCILQDVARNEQYGAVSKHVIKSANKVTLKTDDIDIHGTVVGDTATDGDCSLDIAAIKLETKAVEDNCKFKNSKGDKLLRGIHNDTFIREGIRVYIYGATSSPNPGRGVITCSKMNDIDMRRTIIQIEDSHNSKFASPGDSGAIVCAEDPNGKNVFVLGMVIGASVEDEKKYAAFLLSEGIQQLSGIMKKNLKLM